MFYKSMSKVVKRSFLLHNLKRRGILAKAGKKSVFKRDKFLIHVRIVCAFSFCFVSFLLFLLLPNSAVIRNLVLPCIDKCW